MNTTIFANAVRGLAIVLGAVSAASGQTDIAKRQPWVGSRIVGSPEPPRPYVTERIFPSLVFNQPVELTAIPGTNRLLALEVGGKIYSFENRPQADAVSRDLFGDIKERDPSFTRLFGCAFHPRFAENHECYISYVLKNGDPDGSRVSRFKVTASDPPRLIPESEEVVLRWCGGGHNGAHLQFGPDGYLYISTGDAGNAFPPDGRNTGQDISDLESSILRIDVDHRDNGLPYRIPPDNPFVGVPNARGEVWAYGLRNPWKMSFDPADGSLWVGDVGWEKWELVYAIERGGNYGWSVVEGPQSVHEERPTGPTPILPPAVAHSHIESRSITGGYVSLTSRLPDLRGAWIYGDYVTGKIWALRHDGNKVTWRDELVDTQLQPVSFGRDQNGDVLIVDFPSGTLHRLIPNPRRDANQNFPRKLSETGLFADAAAHRPAAGVVPYSVNAEPWADGTVAERFVALPGDSALDTFTKSDGMVGYFAGDWHFPDGGVLAKTISIELEPGNAASRRRLETQILHYDLDTWKAYNYLWNDEQTDAVLADDVGSDRQLFIRDADASKDPRRQTWHHASRTECILCHTSRVGTVLGFRPNQLDRANHLTNLDAMGLFLQRLPENRVRLPSPHDESEPLEARARAYLHVNCGHCHTRGGGGASFFEVQFQHSLAKTSLIGSRPTQGTFGISGVEIVAPGDPYRSVLYYRMSKLGHGRMPQFGSTVVDSDGTKLIREWIRSLKPDNDANRKSLARLDKERAAALGAVDRDRASESDFATLFASPDNALALVDLLNRWSEPVYDRRKADIIVRGYAQADPAIRDLFERFIPEEKRLQRLGGSIKPADILGLKGDAARGRSLFFETAGVQCKNCHKIGDQGQTLGPDLTQIGKKLDKPKLLENILEPSKTIEPQFVSHLVETTGGEVHTGLLVRRSDAEVVLKKADLKEVTIPAAEIERSVPQQKSLMPDLLLRDLSPQQAADLLAFLAGLK
jgi:putative heme-binding domain-containing protein